MIELALAAFLETTEYQEEAVRIGMAYHCESHQIDGRGIADAVSSARQRWTLSGISGSDIDEAIDGIVTAMENSTEPQGDRQFCLDMFEAMYPED